MKAVFKAPLEKFEDTLYMVHVKVPNEIREAFAAKKIKRIMSSVNGSTPTHNAFLSAGNGIYYIKLSKNTLKEIGADMGDLLQVNIEEDTSKYGMAIPEEMEELLRQDEEGSVLFHKLTPGKIRSLLFKVGGFKSSDKRIEKSVIILEHLKANEGVLDWKMLNEAFKMGI